MNPQTSVEIGPFGIDDQVSCMHAIAAICPVGCDFRTAAARFTDARLSRGTSADHRFTALYNLHHSARCVDVKPISVHTNTSCWSLRHSLQLAGHVYYIGTPTVLGITDPKFKTAKPRIVPGRWWGGILINKCVIWIHFCTQPGLNCNYHEICTSSESIGVSKSIHTGQNTMCDVQGWKITGLQLVPLIMPQITACYYLMLVLCSALGRY